MLVSTMLSHNLIGQNTIIFKNKVFLCFKSMQNYHKFYALANQISLIKSDLNLI